MILRHPNALNVVRSGTCNSVMLRFHNCEAKLQHHKIFQAVKGLKAVQAACHGKDSAAHISDAPRLRRYPQHGVSPACCYEFYNGVAFFLGGQTQ